MMMKKILSFLLLALSVFPLLAWAETTDAYLFTDANQKLRFNYLTQQFRCVVCQNQSLAESHAPLAKDLREQVAGLIRQGHSDQEIEQYLVGRYGEFILFRPVFAGKTYLLWLGPFILLTIGGSVLFTFAHRQARK